MPIHNATPIANRIGALAAEDKNILMYTKKQFLEDVAKEAKALKKHATKEEISKLDFDSLDPAKTFSCIFGQMTGTCKSDRAHELIYACCKRYFHNPDVIDISEITLDKVKKKVNGATIKGVKSAEDLSRHRGYNLEFMSSVEMYIMTPFAKNKNLIDFLKGERKDLVL